MIGGSDLVPLDVGAEDSDEFRRDWHGAWFIAATMLEPSVVVDLAAIGLAFTGGRP